MSKEKERTGSVETPLARLDCLFVERSLRDPLKRDSAVECFRNLTSRIVKGISEGDFSAIAAVVTELNYSDILGIENKAEILSYPVYLQGRLDQLSDIAKAASGRMISDSMRNTLKGKVTRFLRHIAHPIKIFPR